MATRAHLQGFIDYSKPVKNVLEQHIFDIIETDLSFKTASLYPAVNEQGLMVYKTEEAVSSMSAQLRPWYEDVVQGVQDARMAAKYEQWKKVNNKN